MKKILVSSLMIISFNYCLYSQYTVTAPAKKADVPMKDLEINPNDYKTTTPNIPLNLNKSLSDWDFILQKEYEKKIQEEWDNETPTNFYHNFTRSKVKSYLNGDASVKKSFYKKVNVSLCFTKNCKYSNLVIQEKGITTKNITGYFDHFDTYELNGTVYFRYYFLGMNSTITIYTKDENIFGVQIDDKSSGDYFWYDFDKDVINDPKVQRLSFGASSEMDALFLLRNKK